MFEEKILFSPEHYMRHKNCSQRQLAHVKEGLTMVTYTRKEI